MEKQLQEKPKEILEKFFHQLKKEDTLKFLENLPEFLADFYIYGLFKKFGLSLEDIPEFWQKQIDKFLKKKRNKNRKYNFKKISLGLFTYLALKSYYSHKKMLKC